MYRAWRGLINLFFFLVFDYFSVTKYHGKDRKKKILHGIYLFFGFKCLQRRHLGSFSKFTQCLMHTDALVIQPSASLLSPAPTITATTLLSFSPIQTNGIINVRQLSLGTHQSKTVCLPQQGCRTTFHTVKKKTLSWGAPVLLCI